MLLARSKVDIFSNGRDSKINDLDDFQIRPKTSSMSTLSAGSRMIRLTLNEISVKLVTYSRFAIRYSISNK